MIRAARLLTRERPDVHFAVACLHDRHKALAERIVAESAAREGGLPVPAIEVHGGRTPELIRLARVAWAVSGSIGLELMVEGLPSVVLYKVKRFELWLARPFIKAKYISLVNLLAGAEVFPEYLTGRDVSGDLVRWALAWLDDSAARARTTTSLATLRQRVAQPGASDRAADRIISWLRRRWERDPAASVAARSTTAYRGPHDLEPRQERADEPGQSRQ
jgi:lipid-A-disaccharide synthase